MNNEVMDIVISLEKLRQLMQSIQKVDCPKMLKDDFERLLEKYMNEYEKLMFKDIGRNELDKEELS